MSDTAVETEAAPAPTPAEPPVKPGKRKPLLDLDALVRQSIEEHSKDPVTAVVPLFGRDWNLEEPQNVYVALQLTNISDDPFVMIEAAAQYVEPAQRDDFKKALKALPKLTVETLVVLINGLAEAVAGRPTGQSKS